MSEASYALQRIARGTGIIFAGTVISMLFGFFNRAIIARYFTTSEYGVFNLALIVLSIALVIATLGFQNSLPREVAFYREKEPSRVNALISTALVIVLVNSLVWTVILILGAGNIAQVFNEDRLTYSLEIIGLALPFSALIGVIISISRGFGRVREQVYFQNIVYPTAFLAFIVLGVLLDFPFTYVFLASVLAQALTFLALVFDVWRIRLFGFEISLDLKLGRELVRFSLPLLLTGILGFVMTWADTLMLGYYKSSEVVGIYNAASPLAKLIQVFLNSAGFLYVPLATQFYAQEKIAEMKEIYQVLTKWIFALTIPIFSFMLLFPESVIMFSFGAKYTSASLALQILALGFMFDILIGLNGISLVIIGETKFDLFSNIISMTINLILNFLLIPNYGMFGAAFATTVSYIISNILKALRLYQRTKVHSFSFSYIKMLIIYFGLLGGVKDLISESISLNTAIITLVGFLMGYFVLALLTRCIDKEDIGLLILVEEKLGVNLTPIRKVVERFVR